jgi:hypothetical protein
MNIENIFILPISSNSYMRDGLSMLTNGFILWRAGCESDAVYLKSDEVSVGQNYVTHDSNKSGGC